MCGRCRPMINALLHANAMRHAGLNTTTPAAVTKAVPDSVPLEDVSKPWIPRAFHVKRLTRPMISPGPRRRTTPLPRKLSSATLRTSPTCTPAGHLPDRSTTAPAFTSWVCSASSSARSPSVTGSTTSVGYVREAQTLLRHPQPHPKNGSWPPGFTAPRSTRNRPPTKPA